MEPRQLRNRITSRIATLLADRKLTPEWLAGAARIPLSVLISRLTGESSFDTEELGAIATAFGVAVDSLLESDSGDGMQGEGDS